MEDRTNYKRLLKPTLMVEYLLVKTNPLQFLFNGQGNLYVYANKDGHTMRFEISVKSYNDTTQQKDWDCTISNFDSNLWFRTERGRTGEKYKTFGGMINAIKKAIQKEANAKAEYYEIIFRENIFFKA